MTTMRLAVAASLFLPMMGVRAEPHVGDTYVITLIRDSSSKRGEDSSGSSHDKDTIIKRVIAARPDGLEAMYDLPAGATPEERADSWQFPARVLEPFQGPMQLLNEPELEKRVDAWLKRSEIPREACGHWIFTWNAFRIECDPQSVIGTLAAFDLKVADLRDGAPYRDPHALGAVPLIRETTGPSGSTFTAEMKIDPNVARRDRAEADVVVGEITKKPVTLDAALRGRAEEDVTGSISVTLNVDAAGNVHRRTKVTKSKTAKADGSVETETITETIESQLVPQGKP